MTARANRILVTLAAAVTAFGMLFGYGLLGHLVQDSFGGAFRANGTLLTPAGPTFTIWALIYTVAAGFVVWQWLGVRSSRSRIRPASEPAALALLLNGLWLLVVQFNQTGPTGIWLGVAVAFVLELSLVLTLRQLQRDAPADALEALLVDGTFGLHLGWTTVAVIANVTAALVAQGVNAGSGSAQVTAVVVLAVAAALGVAFSVRLGPRLSVAAAMAWGLTWIAVGRFVSDVRSPIVGAVALAAAGVVLVTAVWLRLARRQGELAPAAGLVRE